MGMAFKLKVSDILKRDYFQSADVVAGRKGLARKVKWAHIMEVTEIGQLLNGNEIILSTGVGWKEEDLSLSFLQQLIDYHASALCVELGTYIDEIPRSMIDLAEQNNFPLIVFHQEVRFIDITQDINGMLMDTQDKMMSELESYSNQINRLLLSTDGFKKILRHLKEYLDTQIIYIPVEGTAQFFPSVKKTEQNQLLEAVKSPHQQKSVLSQKIEALSHKFADLVMISRSKELTEFDSLVLDRTATALAQEQLRILYVEEKRKYQENEWVENWLNGKYHKDEIEQRLFSLEPSLKPNGCVVCLYKVDFSKQEPDYTYLSMIFRSIFEQQGFFLLTFYKWDQIVFTLVNKREKTNWKQRLMGALGQIQKTDLMGRPAKATTYFGIGKLFDELYNLHESYQRAQETMQIQKKTGGMDKPFYEELHVYRLILQLNELGMLEEFVLDYLKPVLEFDNKHSSQMFETLKVFLAVQGSKKEASERLFIVRQTLYHRIEKLKELLGEDFMHPEKRLAIEFAIYANQYLI